MIERFALLFLVGVCTACQVGEDYEDEAWVFEDDDTSDDDLDPLAASSAVDGERQGTVQLFLGKNHSDRTIRQTWRHSPCIDPTSPDTSAWTTTIELDLGEVKGTKFYLNSVKTRIVVTDNAPEVVYGAFHAWSGSENARVDVVEGGMMNRTGRWTKRTKVRKWLDFSRSYPAGVMRLTKNNGGCGGIGYNDQLQIFPK